MNSSWMGLKSLGEDDRFRIRNIEGTEVPAGAGRSGLSQVVSARK